LIPTHAKDPVADALRRRDQAVEQALAGLTLQSLVREADDAAAPAPTRSEARGA
jgi:hypothetical protein